MNFENLIDVDQFFFQQFGGVDLDQSVTVTDFNSNTHTFSNHFFKRSAQDFTEITEEDYPRISVFPQLPTFSPDWHNDPENVRKLYGNFRNTSSENGEAFDVGNVFVDPLRLDFVYEVSSACRDYLAHSAIQQYFLVKFKKRGGLKRDVVVINGCEYSKGVVPYKMEQNDVPRSDGVYESNYRITLEAFVQVTEMSEDIKTVITSSIVLNQK